MTEPIRVLLVDDHAIVRDGLRSILSQRRMEVVGEATEGGMAVEMARQLRPDVVLMDIGLPDINGLEATRLVREADDPPRVLILTVYENREYARRAARLGAQGYLVKHVSSDDLSDAICRIHRGETVFPPDLAADGEGDDIRSVPPPEQVLSQRQREVLVLVAEGLSNGEIADRLSVSQRTVETHRRDLCQRLQIYSVAGLTKYAIAAGLTRLDES